MRASTVTYIVLLAVVIAGISIAGWWPEDKSSPWEMKNASQAILIFLGMTLGGGAAITIPALAGSSIVSEREEETIELPETEEVTTTLGSLFKNIKLN